VPACSCCRNVPVVEIPAFCIALYTGPLVYDKDVDDLEEVGSSDQRTTRFRISAGKPDCHLSQHLLTSLNDVDACIDGAGGSSMLTYINCENRSKKQSVAISYVEGVYR